MGTKRTFERLSQSPPTGSNGEGKKKNPPLAGMEESAFIQAMADYKSGAKENKMMARTAKKLSDEDFANLAAYYHSLK